VKFSCCFCGEAGTANDGVQLVVREQSDIDAGRTEKSASWWAHKLCFETAIRPEHRYFSWSEPGE
jgi:hypothetical protein